MATSQKSVQAANAAGVESRPDRRKASRRAVSARVQVSNVAGSGSILTVEDLSSYGCSIKGDTSWLRLGMILSIRLEDDLPVQAVTRWVRSNVAGVEFFRPLNSAQQCWRALLKTQVA